MTPGKTVEERLLLHTAEDSETGCWNCDYSDSEKEYATITIENRQWYAHRVAYWLWVGELIKGLWVCHTCDNCRCINPEHLWLGTQQEDMADMVRKGRSTLGNRNPARMYPERVSRGGRHSKIMKERAARGSTHGLRKHPERASRGEAHSKAIKEGLLKRRSLK